MSMSLPVDDCPIMIPPEFVSDDDGTVLEMRREMASCLLTTFRGKKNVHAAKFSNKLYKRPKNITYHRNARDADADFIANRVNELYNARRTWTPTEDNILRLCVQRSKLLDQTVWWSVIADTHFKGVHTVDQCVRRAAKICSTVPLATGRWSPAETLRLVTAMVEAEKNGSTTCFSDASTALGNTRTRYACENKWRNIRTIISKRTSLSPDQISASYISNILCSLNK